MRRECVIQHVGMPVPLGVLAASTSVGFPLPEDFRRASQGVESAPRQRPPCNSPFPEIAAPSPLPSRLGSKWAPTRALWLREGAWFTNIAEKFAAHPEALPSDFVSGTEAAERADEVPPPVCPGPASIAFGVRINHGGPIIPRSCAKPGTPWSSCIIEASGNSQRGARWPSWAPARRQQRAWARRERNLPVRSRTGASSWSRASPRASTGQCMRRHSRPALRPSP